VLRRIDRSLSGRRVVLCWLVTMLDELVELLRAPVTTGAVDSRTDRH
jgi:hypothetical protein